MGPWFLPFQGGGGGIPQREILRRRKCVQHEQAVCVSSSGQGSGTAPAPSASPLAALTVAGENSDYYLEGVSEPVQAGRVKEKQK